MSCPEPETLCAFADGEIEPATRSQIEAHLLGCPSCREEVAQLEWLNNLAPTALGAIEVKVGPSRGSKSFFTRQRLHPVGIAMAAVILAGLSIGIWFMTRQPMEGDKTPAAAKLTRGHPASVQTDRDTTASGNAAVTTVPSDEAFERWAQPYRRLKIPLVPMEEAGKSLPPVIPPNQPLIPKRNGTG